ncbi:MAG: hypothetical protein IJN09_06585 [Oscillospiraceae bacterium]|nr:hypothetical protein [Oscillospiraceae bacterium]
MLKFEMPEISLKLFDGAGTGEAAGTQPISGSGQPNGDRAGDAALSSGKAETGGAPGEGTGEEEASDAGKQTAEKKTRNERRAEFRRLVEGEYKDIYESEFQRAFNRSHRSARENEERLAEISPVLETLFSRYNIEGSDVTALKAALDNDRSWLESAAEDAGMSTEQYREILKLRSDSRRLAEIDAERERQSAVREQLEAWNRAAEEVRGQYPEFDIETMADNREFMSMLRAGVPMKHAYEVLNLSDIRAQAAREAAERAEKNVVEGIRAKGARPRENGTSSQNGIKTKTDMSKLSLEEIMKINERAKNGEVITFR